jgi:single-stranded DNA-binding protein
METNNQISLIGNVLNVPKLSHEMRGNKIYKFTIAVKRLSGVYDLLPCMIPEHRMNGISWSIDMPIEIIGQVRTLKDTGTYVWVHQVIFHTEELPHKNKVILRGFICKPPVFRETTTREITDILLAVHRDFSNVSDYIHCVAWNKIAHFASTLEVGEKIEITGRLQSRQGNYDKTFYDMSIGIIRRIEDDN